MARFRVLQGCPCNEMIAPYFAIIVSEAHATVNSLYRGADADPILHAHGHEDQAEIHRDPRYAKISNPAGRSTHELRSDGVAYRGPIGRQLEEWQQGIDVNDGDVHRCIQVGLKHGWHLFQPYPAGSEYHHLNFKVKPTPYGVVMRARLIKVRHSLPTR